MNSRTNHILLTGSALPRSGGSAGEGAAGFSPTHSDTAMITPLTWQNPTHKGRTVFRITAVY